MAFGSWVNDEGVDAPRGLLLSPMSSSKGCLATGGAPAPGLVNPHAFMRDLNGPFSRPLVMEVKHSPSRLERNPSLCVGCSGPPPLSNLHAIDNDEYVGSVALYL
jgi:hypothetical protein